MNVLITSGGTRQYIDPVRFISNASTGQMGYALAEAAVKAGHKVTLISANVSLAKPAGVKLIEVETTIEMFEAVKKAFPKCDCLIMAAAVCDYIVDKPSVNKIKKTDKELTLKLKPAPDILKWAGAHKKKQQKVVGFALEDKNLRKNAEKKLTEKNLDMIIANTPDSIGAAKTTVEILSHSSKWYKTNGSKIMIAKQIIETVENIK